MVSPALVLLLALTIVPAAYLFWNSLFHYRLLSPGKSFAGLDNYRFAFTDGPTLHSMLITLVFVVVVVSLELVLGLALAVPLVRRTRGNAIASTLLLLPFAMTPAVSAMIWQQLLDPNWGWIDWYAQKAGLMNAPVQWLGSPATAWISIVALDIWQYTPFVTLILVAGLGGLPREPAEAAEVDGASSWQLFRHVTFPLLAPFVAIAVLLRVIDAFKTFASVQVLTNGGPGTSTELISLRIYRVALQDFDIGSAAALGVGFLIVLSLAIPPIVRVLARNSELMGRSG